MPLNAQTKFRTRRLALLAAALVFTLAFAGTRPAQAGGTLDKIRAAGRLACGLETEEPDFTTLDTHGNLTAFGANLCKAVAVAVLGPNAKVDYLSQPDDEHLMRAVASGKTAVGFGTTPSATHAVRYGVAFGSTVFFDGQGFLVRRDRIHKLKDLAGKRICFISDTAAEAAFTETLPLYGIKALPFPFEEMGEMEVALVDNHCDAIIGDASLLAADRAGFHGRATDFDVLPDLITEDPWAPVLPRDDSEWALIVNETMAALIAAEERGISQQNVDRMMKSPDPAIQRLLGTDPVVGRQLKLDDHWGAAVIKSVGNYGELYQRDVTAKIGLPRGLNAPWTKGGLLYPPPFE